MLLFRCHRWGTILGPLPHTPEAISPPSVALLFVISPTAFRPPLRGRSAYICQPSFRDRSHIRNGSYTVDRPHRAAWRGTVPSHARNGFDVVLQSMPMFVVDAFHDKGSTFLTKIFWCAVRLLKLTNYSIISFVFTIRFDTYVRT